MRDLWRGIVGALVLLAALPAAAETRTCLVDFETGGGRLSVSRSGDGSGQGDFESAYLLVLPERDAKTPYWISASLIPGSTLNLTLTYDAPGRPRHRWTVSGALQTVITTTVDRYFMRDWASLDREFANDREIKVSVSLDQPNAPVLSAITLSLDDLRAAVAARPAVSAVATWLLADPASDCADRNPPSAHYAVDCGEHWQDQEGNYSTYAGQLEWNRPLGDHVRLRLNLYSPDRGFAAGAQRSSRAPDDALFR